MKLTTSQIIKILIIIVILLSILVLGYFFMTQEDSRNSEIKKSDYAPSTGDALNEGELNNELSVFKENNGDEWSITGDQKRPTRIYGGGGGGGSSSTPPEETQILITLETIEEAGKEFISDNNNLLKIDIETLQVIGNNVEVANSEIGQITYQQTYKDLPVQNSFISIIFKDNRFISYHGNYFDIPELSIIPTISPTQASRRAAEAFELPPLFQGDTELVIYPVPNTPDFKLANRVQLPLFQGHQYTVILDAHTNEVLDYFDNVVSSISGKITGNIFNEHPSETPIEKEFRDEFVHLNDEVIKSDEQGDYFEDVEGTVELSSKLEGPWVEVIPGDKKIEPYYWDIEIDSESGAIFVEKFHKIKKIDSNGENFIDILTPLLYGLSFELYDSNIYYMGCVNVNGIDCYHPQYIKKINLDGTSEEILIELDSEKYLSDIHIDEINGKLYWILSSYDFNTDSSESFIMKSNIDGTQIDQILTYSEGSASSLTTSEDNLYFVDSENDAIYIADLNGNNLNKLIDISEPHKIKYNSQDQKLYLVNFDYDLNNRFVSRINLDGSNLEQIYNLGTSPMMSFEFNYQDDKIYWVDFREDVLKSADFNFESINSIDVEIDSTMHDSSLVSPATHDWNWDQEDDSDRNERSNVFFHTNLIHKFFANLDVKELNVQFKATVNLDGACNAYYYGDSINFFPQTVNCENTALLSDVIYHEYTHGLVDHLVHVPFPYFDQTGNLNEAWADYFAITINDNPCIAEGFFKDDPTRPCLRNAKNSNRWPEDYDPEPHTGSPIIAGALWDLREDLGSEITDTLVVQAIRLQPVTFQMFLESLLIADDDNTNLGDGTPHLNSICDAFSVNHGVDSVYCPEISTTFSRIINNGKETFDANITVTIQKKVEGVWIDYNEGPDGESNNFEERIQIPAGESFRLANWFNDLGIRINENGIFRAKTELENEFGTSLRDLEGNLLTTFQEFSVGPIPSKLEYHFTFDNTLRNLGRGFNRFIKTQGIIGYSEGIQNNALAISSETEFEGLPFYFRKISNNSLSIGLWVQIDTEGTILEKVDDLTENGFSLIGHADRVTFRAGGSEEIICERDFGSALNYLVVTAQDNLGIQIYYNGELCASAPPGIKDVYGSGKLRLGVENFGGIVDDLKLYSGILSGTEITEEYGSKDLSKIGPVFHYSFEEEQAPYYDSIHNIPLTLFNSQPKKIQGPLGNNALEFSGDSSLSISHSELEPWSTESITISFLTKFDEGQGTLIQKRSNSSHLDGLKGYRIFTNPNRIKLQAGGIGNGGPLRCYLDPTTWNHIVITATTLNYERIYVNGELCRQKKAGKRGMISPTDFILGLPGFKGSIDELKMWNVELSEDEIASEYAEYDPSSICEDYYRGVEFDGFCFTDLENYPHKEAEKGILKYTHFNSDVERIVEYPQSIKLNDYIVNEESSLDTTINFTFINGGTNQETINLGDFRIKNGRPPNSYGTISLPETYEYTINPGETKKVEIPISAKGNLFSITNGHIYFVDQDAGNILPRIIYYTDYDEFYDIDIEEEMCGTKLYAKGQGICSKDIFIPAIKRFSCRTDLDCIESPYFSVGETYGVSCFEFNCLPTGENKLLGPRDKLYTIGILPIYITDEETEYLSMREQVDDELERITPLMGKWFDDEKEYWNVEDNFDLEFSQITEKCTLTHEEYNNIAPNLGSPPSKADTKEIIERCVGDNNYDTVYVTFHLDTFFTGDFNRAGGGSNARDIVWGAMNMRTILHEILHSFGERDLSFADYIFQDCYLYNYNKNKDWDFQHLCTIEAMQLGWLEKFPVN